MDLKKIDDLKKHLRYEQLPPSDQYTDMHFEFISIKNRISKKFHLVKENNSNNYLFFIKRVANYYANNLINTNMSYNIWDNAEAYNNIK